jgi:hypothetical protein
MQAGGAGESGDIGAIVDDQDGAGGDRFNLNCVGEIEERSARHAFAAQLQARHTAAEKSARDVERRTARSRAHVVVNNRVELVEAAVRQFRRVAASLAWRQSAP